MRRRVVACMSHEGTAGRAHRSFKVPSFFVVLNHQRPSPAWGSGFDLDHRSESCGYLEMMVTDGDGHDGDGLLAVSGRPRG